jgi:multidrug efflux pump subunit AcrB
MSEDIELDVNSLNSKFEKLSKDIDGLDKLSEVSRIIEMTRIKKELETCKSKVSIISASISLLPNGNDKSKWKNEKRELDLKSKTMEADLKFWEAPTKPSSNAAGPKNELEMIDYGNKKMNEIDGMADRVLEDLDNAEKIGIDVGVELKKGGDVLVKVGDDLKEIDDSLERATKATKRMARRLLTDKYVWILVILIIIAIIVIVVLKVNGFHIPSKMGNV